MSDKIPVILEGGGGGYLSKEEAAQAFRDGSARAPETAAELGAIRAQEQQALKAEQYGGLENQLKTGVLNAAQSATMGAFNPLAAAVYGQRAVDDIRALNEVNPNSAMAGTVAGFLAPGPAAGLVGSVGRGVAGTTGKLLGPGALGTIAGKALGMGAETALMGGANELSRELTEEALGNHALNAERIFHAAADDFTFGAILGGTLGVGSVVGKKALGGVAKLLGGEGSTLRGALDDFAGSATYRQLGGTKGMANKAGKVVPGGREAIGNTLINDAEEVLGRAPRDIDDLAEVIKAKKPAIGAELGAARDRASEVLEKAGQSPKTYETLLDAEAKVLKDLKGAAAVGRGGDIAEIKAMFRDAHIQMGTTDAAGELLPDAMSKTMKLTELDQIQKNFADKFWPKPGTMPTNQNPLLQDAYRTLRETIEAKQALAGELGGENLAKQIKEASKKFQVYAEAEKAVNNGLAREGANNAFGLTSRMSGLTGAAVSGMLGAGPVGSLVAGGASMVAGKLADRFGPLALARAARGASKVLEVGEVARSAKLTTDAAVGGLLDGVRVAGERAAVDVFEGKDRQAKVERTLAALNDTQRQTEQFAKRAESLGAEVPRTQMALASQAHNVTNYLLTQAPKPSVSGLSLAPWMDKPQYTDSEIAKFASAIKVAADPMSVIRKAGKGLTTFDDVQALKAMYPQTYQEARSSFISLLVDPKNHAKVKAMPLDKQLAITTLFDIPTPLTEPGFVGAIQRGIAEQDAQQIKSSDQPTQRREGDAKAAAVQSSVMRTDTERLDTYGSEL